jgi:hypothetical protein
MQLILPSWFKQRQGKAEPAGENIYRLTAPNMGEAFIRIQPAPNGKWSAYLRGAAEGPDLEASAPELDTAPEAWQAAFEYYRTTLLI